MSLVFFYDSQLHRLWGHGRHCPGNCTLAGATWWSSACEICGRFPCHLLKSGYKLIGQMMWLLFSVNEWTWRCWHNVNSVQWMCLQRLSHIEHCCVSINNQSCLRLFAACFLFSILFCLFSTATTDDIACGVFLSCYVHWLESCHYCFLITLFGCNYEQLFFAVIFVWIWSCLTKLVASALM